MKYGKINLNFIEFDGETETTGTIEMEPCNSFHVFYNSHSQSKNEIMQRHINANQFFCPVDDDLQIWGEKSDLHSRILTIEIGKCDPDKLENDQTCAEDSLSWLAGKDILLLIND